MCSSRSRPASSRCSGASSLEDLQRALHARASRHRCPRGAAQIRVVEVCQPVGRGTYLAAHPAFLPGHDRLVRAQPGEQRADHVAVANRPRGPRREPRGPWSCTPSRRPTPTSASADSADGQVISSAQARPGSVSEPWARKAPRQAASASAMPPATTWCGSPLDRPPAQVDQAGSGGPAPRRPGPPAPGSGCPCAARRRPRSVPRSRARRSPRSPCAAAGRRSRCPARPRSRCARPTRCSAPAKRNIVASSALRADILATGTRLSSSFTADVIAMRLALQSVRRHRARARNASAQPPGVVALHAVVGCEPRHYETRADRARVLVKIAGVGHRVLVGEHGVDAQAAHGFGVLLQDVAAGPAASIRRSRPPAGRG